MPLPECYGVFWEAIASNPACNEQCGAKNDCLVKFATETLVKYQRELGEQATIHHLAELTGVAPEAILLAIDFQKNKGLQKAEAETEEAPAEEAPAEVPTPEAAPEPQDETIEVTEDAPLGPPPVADQEVPVPPPVGEPGAVTTPPEVPAPESVPEPPAQAEAPAEEEQEEPVAKSKPKKNPPAKKKAAPRTKGAATKKKAAPATKTAKAKPKSTKKPPAKATPKKAPPRTKKKPPKKSQETDANFRKAGTASRAAVPAKAAKAGSASPAGAPEESKEWHRKFDQARFERERKRSPLIRQLPVGYVLVRRWPYENGKGPKHRVVVKKDHYTYCSRKYPTLYSVMKAITGTKSHKKQYRHDGTRPRGTRELTTWSAAKFFGLAKLILTLAEEKAGKGRNKKLPKQPKRNLPRRGPSKKPAKKSRRSK